MNIHHNSSKLLLRIGLLAAAAAASAGAAPAVNVPVGVGAGAGAAGNLGIGLGAGGSAGAPNGGFGGARAIGGAGAAGSRGHVGANGEAGIPDLHIQGSDFESIGMRQSRNEARAANAGGVALNAPGMSVANQHAVTAVTNAGPSPQTIRTTNMAARGQLATDVNERIDARAKEVASLKARSRGLRGDEKAEFKAAIKDVEVREKALRKSVKVASKASAETWTDSRASVATDYEAYTQAVARAEAIAASSSANGDAVGTAGAKAGR